MRKELTSIFHPSMSKLELKDRVENRTAFYFDNCELNLFETRDIASSVKLQFPELAVTAMIKGKKIMHLFGQDGFDYLPGELVLVPKGEQMVIDFPEASDNTPTQCIALTINDNIIKDTLILLNDQQPKAESQDKWELSMENFHLQSSNGSSDTINRLTYLPYETNPNSRKLLADLMIKELLVRLMQTQARTAILENYAQKTSWHRFAHVMEYIKNNLNEHINIEKLSSMACMSKPNFFKSFKQEFGITPLDLIIKERIKLAKELLSEQKHSIAEVCYQTGFNNMSHFFRLFKKEEGITPNNYKKTRIH